MAETCAFIKENGKRCGAYPPTGAKYCLWHDPDRVEEARKARMKGAYNAVNKPLPPSDVPELTPEDEVDLVIPVLQRAVRQLEEMRPSPSTLGSVAIVLVWCLLP